MNRWGGIAIVAGLIGLVLSQLIPTTSRLRYRMTVEVDTPEGIRSGASIIEAEIIRQLAVMGSDGIVYRLRGEAVVVDLPEGQALFALLGNEPYHVALPTNGLRRGLSEPPVTPQLDARERDAADWPALRRTRPLITLAAEDYPRLIRFRDLADPESVEIVDPMDLRAAFGADVRLVRITIQPTDEDGVARVERRLPWLFTTVTNYLPGPVAQARSLNVVNFKTGQ